MKKRGFIPLVVIAIVGLVTVLTAGGAYTVYKVNQLEKENQRISDELIAQKQTSEEEDEVAEEIGITSTLVATTTSPLATTSTEKSPQTEIIKTPQVERSITIPKQSVGGVSSKDLIETIDIWIKKSESFSDSINEYIATINYYSGTAAKSNEALSKLIDTETDSYLLRQWQYLSSITGGLVKIGASLKSGTELKGSVSNLTNSVNDYTGGLVKKRNEIPEYYSNDEILKAEFLRLIDYQYASYGKVLDEIYNAKMEYLGVVELSMSKVSETEPDIRAYMSSQKISNTTIINSPIYQPITTPQIQMPKTTYCDMHETGALNYYSISCNTY